MASHMVNHLRMLSARPGEAQPIAAADPAFVVDWVYEGSGFGTQAVGARIIAKRKTPPIWLIGFADG